MRFKGGCRRTLLGRLGENHSRLAASSSFSFTVMPLKGQEKTVNVKMPKSCHQVVQVLKAQYDIPMGDVMYYPARHEIHKQAVYCRFMRGALNQAGIALDPHAKKDCYGFWCKNCIHEAACKIGRYQGVFEIDESIFRQFGTNEGRDAILKIQQDAGQKVQPFLEEINFNEDGSIGWRGSMGPKV